MEFIITNGYIISLVIAVIFLISWVKLCVNVAAIRKELDRPQRDLLQDAKIAEMVGDNKEAAKLYIEYVQAQMSSIENESAQWGEGVKEKEIKTLEADYRQLIDRLGSCDSASLFV